MPGWQVQDVAALPPWFRFMRKSPKGVLEIVRELAHPSPVVHSISEGESPLEVARRGSRQVDDPAGIADGCGIGSGWLFRQLFFRRQIR